MNAPRLFGLYPILEWLSSALAFALAALLHRECLFRLVSLLSHPIRDCYRNLILPRRGLRQQRNPHGSHHVALGIETLALLHRRLGLGPQHLPAGPEHAADVAHVDAILVTIFEPDDVELSPWRTAAPVDGFLNWLRVLLPAEELKVPRHQGIAGLHGFTADFKRHTEFGLRVGHQVFN